MSSDTMSTSDDSSESLDETEGVRIYGRGLYTKRNLNSKLLDAVLKGDLSHVESLLEKGGSACAVCIPHGELCTTACHVAAYWGHADIVRLLVGRGAQGECVDGSGCTPAHLAAWNGHHRVLEELHRHDHRSTSSHVVALDEIEKSPKDLRTWDSLAHDHDSLSQLVAETFREGSTALHLACQRANIDCVDFLLLKGASVHSQDRQGLSPLDVVGMAYNKKEPEEQCLIRKTVRSLLGRGATFPKPNEKKGVTVLHTAVLRDDTNLIRFLVESGAQPSTFNDDGDTAVHLAVKNMIEGSLMELLKTNNFLNIRDTQGRTPLHLAVAQDWRTGVSILLEAGADIQITSYNSKTLLHIAAEQDNYTILQELLSLPESSEILEVRDSDSYTAICRAACSNSVRCVELLRESGADTSVRLPSGVTLLHLAAETNSPAVLRYILRDKIVILSVGDVLFKTEQGLVTALHLAARTGQTESVRCIVEYNKESVRARDERGWYPLHVAARNGHKDCVRLMLENGADLSDSIPVQRKDGTGRYQYPTALDFIAFCIPKPAEFLEEIFDSYVSVHRCSVDDPHCDIEVKCDILVPFFDKRKPQMKVLSALVKTKRMEFQERLLLHPIVETFLHLKWERLKPFFFFIMFLYVVLTFSLTSMGMMYNVFENEISFGSVADYILKITTFVPWLLILLIEMASMKQKFFTKDVEFYVKMLILLGTVVALVQPEDWGRYPTAFTVLLCWMQLLFLLSRFPRGGYYVLMFTTVTAKFFKVLATFAFLMLGFSFALMIHFKATEPFPGIVQTIIKVIVMMTEMDYAGTFDPEVLPKESLAFSLIGRLLYLAFDILAVVVLMNLMVGLAVADVAKLENQGRAQRLAKQIISLGGLEALAYNESLVSCLPPPLGRLVIQRRWVSTWIVNGRCTIPSSAFPQLPRHVRQAIINKVMQLGIPTPEGAGSYADYCDSRKRKSEHLRNEK